MVHRQRGMPLDAEVGQGRNDTGFVADRASGLASRISRTLNRFPVAHHEIEAVTC